MLTNSISSDYTNFIEDAIREHLMNLLKINLSNEDIMDEVDKQCIYKKVKEIQERNNCKGLFLNVKKGLYNNCDYDSHFVFAFVLLMCLCYYINESLPLIVSISLCLSLPTIFYVSIFIVFKNISSQNVNKFFDCIKKKKVLVQYSCLMLLKRYDGSFSSFKMSNASNLTDKELRSSCLNCMKKIISSLINTSKNEFICQKDNTNVSSDEINEYIAQLCNNDSNNSEFHNKNFETNYLSSLLKYLDKCEFDFLSYLCFEIQGMLIIKRKEISIWKRWWRIWKISLSIEKLAFIYDKELSLLETVYIKINKFEINENKFVEKIEVGKPTVIDKRRQFVNDIIKSLENELQIIKDGEIIGNEILLGLTESFCEFLRSKKKKTRKSKNKKKSSKVNGFPLKIENNLPKYDKKDITFNDFSEVDERVVKNIKRSSTAVEKSNSKQGKMSDAIEEYIPILNQNTIVDKMLEESFENEVIKVNENQTINLENEKFGNTCESLNITENMVESIYELVEKHSMEGDKECIVSNDASEVEEEVINQYEMLPNNIEEILQNEVKANIIIEEKNINTLYNQRVNEFNNSLIEDLKNQCFFNEEFIYDEILF